MNKIQILGLITLVIGFIVTEIGTFVESNWNLNNLMAEGGPYSTTGMGWRCYCHSKRLSFDL